MVRNMSPKALTLLALLAACMAPASLAEDCIKDSKEILLALSDRALYNVALDGIEDESGTVNCRIIDATGKEGACDLYVKVCSDACIREPLHGWLLHRLQPPVHSLSQHMEGHPVLRCCQHLNPSSCRSEEPPCRPLWSHVHHRCST